MRRLLWWGAALALLSLAQPAAAGAPWVIIMSPHDGAQVMGEVVISARGGPAGELILVEFVVDGQPVGSLAQPPYELTLDLGADNVAHTIEVVAQNGDGDQARAQVSTRPVPLGAEFEVDLRQLYLTVTRDGERELELEQEDFELFDDGARQRVVTFARGDLPFTASILVDASASMRGGKLAAAVAGAEAFLNQMRALDQVQLSVFSDSLKLHTPIGAGREVLLAGLGWVRAGGGTAIADHLWAALKLLASRQGRRVAVLMSDGVDSHSVLPMSAVLDAARRDQVIVYWVRVGGERELGRGGMSSAWHDAAAYREQLATLEQIVSDSGGRVIPVSATAELQPALLAILEELRGQYALGYYPTPRRRDGSWRRVTVTVDADGAKLRTARGYLDF